MSKPIIERLFPSGGWIVSDIVNGQFIKRKYFDYTKREALQQFKADTRKANA